MEKVYSDDVDIEMLTTKMEIFKVLLKDGDFLCLDDIIVKIKEYPRTENDKRSHAYASSYW